MNIHHQEKDAKGTFTMEKHGEMLARLFYTTAGFDKIVIDGIDISELLRGQEAELTLVLAAVAYSRAHSLKIIPICTVAINILNDPQFEDVLN
jgi:predicted GNAT family acetyltransferase